MHAKFEYIILDIGTGHWVFLKLNLSILCLQCICLYVTKNVSLSHQLTAYCQIENSKK